MRTFMVIEHIRPGARETVYARFHEKGRMLPEGLQYVDSWLELGGDRCFQLMRTDDPTLFAAWTPNWEDLIEFEIVELGIKPTTGTE